MRSSRDLSPEKNPATIDLIWLMKMDHFKDEVDDMGFELVHDLWFVFFTIISRPLMTVKFCVFLGKYIFWKLRHSNHDYLLQWHISIIVS